MCVSNSQKYLPPDTLKIHSLALTVLRFLCKTFCKLGKFTLWNTLLHGWFSKISYIQIKICMAIKLWELGSNLSWKDAASSTERITRSSWSSVNYSCQRNKKKFKIKMKNQKLEYLHDLLHIKFLLSLRFLSAFSSSKSFQNNLMHCEITDSYFNELFVEVQLEKENLKSVFWHPNRYTSLPNSMNMSLLY